ncbi:MAG: glycosyl hydrolase 53 family protein [Eubacteriales bacterium]|nr:glycosyl hydrolase 53 family protein [Eubacteriales bacterium]
MNKSTIGCLLVALMLLGTLFGCKQAAYEPGAEVFSDTLYVEKFDNLPQDFIMGVDASSVPALEAGGVKFYDFDGVETDVFKVLRDNGINYIRVRVWVDPYNSEGKGYGGGNCDIDTAIEIGKRATEYGMKLLVDFHYSDFWADPSKQMVPKAWAGMKIEEKTEALYQYTLDCLNKLKKAKVDVGMVQVGNETNGSMCGEKIWMNIYYLMDAGSRAIREVFPDALVAVHFANPEKITNYQDYAKKLNYYSLDYDVFASSYYPYWHGTLDNLSSLLSQIAQTYDKKVMVAELSYAYTPDDTDFFGNTITAGSMVEKDYPFTVQGQANCVRNVIDTIANRTTNGIGVFYWEGTWISSGGTTYEENKALWEEYGSGWATSYSAQYDPNDAGKYYGGCACDNQALFDAQGKPLESLKVFEMVKTGNVIEPRADAIEDSNLMVDLNGKIELPTTVNAVMSDNSKQEVAVDWGEVDYDGMYSGGVNKYDIVGTADGMEAHCFVSMVEYNFLENYSFETGDDSGWTVLGGEKLDELYVENKPTDSMTGACHFHFWSANPNTVEFALEQQVSELPSGTYKYTISIMGGDAGENAQIYSYVKINGEIVKTCDMEITVYDSWNTAVIDDIEYTLGDTLTVGIFVKCQGSGNGAWGKIDDALLNSK